MEVARSWGEEEAAAENWFPVSTRGSITPLIRHDRYIGSQSTAAPRSWLPQYVAGMLLSCLVTQANARENNELLRAWDSEWIRKFDLHLDNYKNESTGASLLTQRLEEVESLLNLTRSQLSQALRVERATLYQWFRGAQPRAKTSERLERLREFAAAWNRAGLASARTAWYFSAPETSSSLGSLLTEEPLDSNKLQVFLECAKKAPSKLQLYKQEKLYGFPADTETEERRRDDEIFPPTLKNGE